MYIHIFCLSPSLGQRDGKDDGRVMGNSSTSMATLLPTNNNIIQPLPTGHHVVPSSTYQHSSSHHITTTTGSATGRGRKIISKKSSAGKMATIAKPLSTRERMSLFLEHSGQGKSAAAMTTPKVIIKRDTKFKAACNKLKWFNKGSEPVEQSVTKAPSVAGDSSKIEESAEDNGQFYSFHEKVDPSIDEAVNPPVKLPTVLLVSGSLLYVHACVCVRVCTSVSFVCVRVCTSVSFVCMHVCIHACVRVCSCVLLDVEVYE